MVRKSALHPLDRWRSVSRSGDGEFLIERSEDELDALDLLDKPSARERPIGFYGGARNVENLSDFLIRAAAKITQFHDLGLNRIFLGKFVQRFMHGQ